MKVKAVIGISALLIAGIAFFTAGGNNAAEGQRDAAPKAQPSLGGAETVEKLYPENKSDRTFKIDLSAWDSSGNELSEPVNVLLCLEMSERMGWLAESPIENRCYFKGDEYSDLENTDLYAIDNGEYKPLTNRKGRWYIEGVSQPAGETVSAEGETLEKFNVDAYEKGSCGTRLERLQKAACDFIDRLSQKSPGSRVSLIFYGGMSGGENSVKLDSEGAELLKSRINSMKNESDKNVPLPLAKAFYMLDENRARNFTVNLSCTPFVKSDDTDYPEDVLKKLDMYCFIDIAGGMSERPFYFAPPEKIFRGDPSGIFDKAFSDIMEEDSANITYSLDPRFTLTEKSARELEEDYSVTEAGESEISFKAVLGGKDEIWKKQLEVTAKSDFIGGNNIPLGEILISKNGKTLFEFEKAAVNVPVKFHVSQADASIFKGESVPLDFGGTGIAEAMAGSAGYNFYGMGETGALNYKWTDGEGRDAGSTGELGNIIPQENTAYTLEVTFTPGEEAMPDSVGKPAESAALKGIYRIKVKPGSIKGTVKGKGCEGRVYTFSLKGENGTKYRSVMFTEKESSDDLAALSAEFTDLPAGQYTLSCESTAEDEKITVTAFDNGRISEGKAVFSIGTDEDGSVTSYCGAEFTAEALGNGAEAADYCRITFGE